MADQQRHEQAGRQPVDERSADRTGERPGGDWDRRTGPNRGANADHTVVMPAVAWPSVEPSESSPTVPVTPATTASGGETGQARDTSQPREAGHASAQPGQPSRDPGDETRFIDRPTVQHAPASPAPTPPPGPAPAAEPTERTERTERTELFGGAGESDWSGELTEVIPAVVDEPERSRRGLRRALVGAAIAIGAIGLMYGVDLVMARGEVPRGVVVAGVDVGGLSRTAAEQKLRDELGPRIDEPIAVRIGGLDATIEPEVAGLAADLPATVAQAGDQPLNPWTRLRSVFADREVGVVSTADQDKLTTAVQALKDVTDRAPAEGTIQFDGTTPVAVNPMPGQSLNVPDAAAAITASWADGETIELPVDSTPVRSTAESVQAALDGIAKPAVSGPVTVNGEGGAATLTPEVIAAALTFEVGEDGALNPKLDTTKVVEALQPQLAPTEQAGKDATVVIEGGRPVVQPSTDGRGVDWNASLTELPNVLRGTDNRTLTATYAHQPAKFTTDQANALGIKEVVAEFTTGGFAADSGVNIRQIASEVNGALVKPGEVFSLNGHTGPRGAAQGYVEAGIIERGRPGRAIGGGASQFATTLFNATYFAGMTDVEHKEHSFYISRYPEGREATVFEGVIDLKFRNDSPSGVLIQSIWTPSSITVKIWSTKHYEVESVTGGRSNFTSPNTVTIPPGERCSPSSGAPGFSVSNTRIVRDARTGAEVKRNSRNAVYNPLPKVVCEQAPAQPG